MEITLFIPGMIKMKQEFNQEYFSLLSKELKDFEIINSLILKYLGESLNILDLGCGTGELALKLSQQYYTHTCIGVDISEYACMETTKKGIECIVADALNLPFEDGKFDLVVMREVYEHFTREDQRKLLNEVYRVMAPHSYFILTTPNLWDITRMLCKLKGEKWYGFQDKTHFGLVNPINLKNTLQKEGFEVLYLSSKELDLRSLDIKLEVSNSILERLILPKYFFTGLIIFARI